MESSAKLNALPPLPDTQGPKGLLAWQARKYLEARIGPLAKSAKPKFEKRNSRQGELAFMSPTRQSRYGDGARKG